MPKVFRNRIARPPAAAPRWKKLDEAGEYGRLCSVRMRHAVQVREPLVLISQVERSGGTLLSRLFDGHAECHAHPRELEIGYPKTRDWPPLDLERPEACFEVLYEKAAAQYLKRGSWKSRGPNKAETFPFLFSPSLQHALFEACVAGRRIEGERDVLDCYFTSYFNAWLDNHNLYTGPKKLVTGFAPRLAMKLERVDRFFAAYPDGTLLSIVRDPRGWYVSARRHSSKNEDVVPALRRWRRSATAALEARKRFGERVLVLTYDDLVLETEATMTCLAERLGLTMSPLLLEPTFNGLPIRANSGVVIERHGVLPERADAWREELDPATKARIDELSTDLYEHARAVSLSLV